jgi:undecaprenyl-diphosphatase
MGAAVIVGGVALACFVVLAVALLLAPAFIRLDMALSDAIRSLVTPRLSGIAKAATWLGGLWPMVVLTLAIGAAFAWRDRRMSGLMMVVAVFGAGILGNALKFLFLRARPAVAALVEVPESYSFPSGHAMTSFVFFGTLGFLAVLHRRSLRGAVLSVAGGALAALAVGLSRVYLGAHYLGDVVGAWLLGAAWLALVVLVFARWGTGDAEGGPTAPAEASG